MWSPCIYERSAAPMGATLLQCAIWRVLHAAFETFLVLSETSAWLSRQFRTSRSSTLEPQGAPPAHLGVIVSTDEAADVSGVAAVVRASVEAGVRFITICEASGDLARSKAALKSHLVAEGLSDVHVLSEGERPTKAYGGTDCPAEVATCVRLVTLAAGRDDLVRAARAVCEHVAASRLAADAIDEHVIERELRANEGFPEPELILQCCPEPFLGGLLPWHCRVTQYVHIGSLRALTPVRMHEALVEYGGVQQRYGT